MRKLRSWLSRNSASLMIIMFAVMTSALTASAQTATPVPPTAVPTAVPVVAISLDTNAIFTSANGWISNLTPVYAIGIGIGIAAAILGFVGVAIIRALRGSGSK